MAYNNLLRVIWTKADLKKGILKQILMNYVLAVMVIT